MQLTSSDKEMLKPVLGATIGSVVAAIGTMYVPAHLVENLTGATGMSEIFPSTAAPLGDTARALIAYTAGALVFAFLLAFFWEKSGVARSGQRPVRHKAMIRNTHESHLPVLDKLRDWQGQGREMIVSLVGRLRAITKNGLFNGAGAGMIRSFSDLAPRKEEYRDTLILDTRDLGEPLPPVERDGLALAQADALTDEFEGDAGWLEPETEEDRASCVMVKPDEPNEVFEQNESAEMKIETLASPAPVEPIAIDQAMESLGSDGVAPQSQRPETNMYRDGAIDHLMMRLQRGLQSRMVSAPSEQATDAGDLVSPVDEDAIELWTDSPSITKGADFDDIGPGVSMPSFAPLRAVPAPQAESSAHSGDAAMDDALRSALKTLRRMTAQAR